MLSVLKIFRCFSFEGFLCFGVAELSLVAGFQCVTVSTMPLEGLKTNPRPYDLDWVFRLLARRLTMFAQYALYHV